MIGNNIEISSMRNKTNRLEQLFMDMVSTEASANNKISTWNTNAGTSETKEAETT